MANTLTSVYKISHDAYKQGDLGRLFATVDEIVTLHFLHSYPPLLADCSSLASTTPSLFALLQDQGMEPLEKA